MSTMLRPTDKLDGNGSSTAGSLGTADGLGSSRGIATVMIPSVGDAAIFCGGTTDGEGAVAAGPNGSEEGASEQAKYERRGHALKGW